jgi:hypothetical protein
MDFGDHARHSAIRVHPRSSAANNSSEKYQLIAVHLYWPLMNADERGFQA